MRTRGFVPCPTHLIGTPQQMLWRKKWGQGKMNSGPSGRKAKPGYRFRKVLAETLASYKARRKAK